jgi:hypothetical protein
VAIGPTEAGPSEARPIELAEESAQEGSKHPAPEAPHKELEFIIRHALGKQLSSEQIAEVEHYARDLKYPRGSLVYRGNDKEDFLYCLPDNKEINVCHEMMNIMGFLKLELGLSAMSKDQLADNLAFNSLKVCKFWVRVLVLSELFFSNSYICCLLFCFILQGLILSKTLKAQKDVEDESCQMALSNLRSEVITLRNEALTKDKILLSLVKRLKSSEAKMSTQAEAHKAEVQQLKRKVAEATENFDVEVVKHEICEIERSRAQKNVDELRAGKEKCYEISMECAKKLKNSFYKVGAFSSEQKFIHGDPDGVIQWISGEAKTFEEILSDRGFCAFASGHRVVSILEKVGCDHAKAVVQPEFVFSADDIKTPSAEASALGG